MVCVVFMLVHMENVCLGRHSLLNRKVTQMIQPPLVVTNQTYTTICLFCCKNYIHVNNWFFRTFNLDNVGSFPQVSDFGFCRGDFSFRKFSSFFTFWLVLCSMFCYRIFPNIFSFVILTAVFLWSLFLPVIVRSSSPSAVSYPVINLTCVAF